MDHGNWRRCRGRALVALALLAWAGLAAAKGPLFLWEVRDNGGALRGYLYGTLHVCDAGCYPLPREVAAAFAAADSLALELDPQDPTLSAALAGAGTLPPRQTLDALLAPEQRRRLAAAERRIGLPARALQPMRPWMASAVLTLRAAAAAGFDTAQGIDLWLAREAQTRGMPLAALESVTRQLDALAAGGPAAQAANLMEVVELINNNEAHALFAAMLDAWRAGDVAELDRLLREEASAPEMAPLLAELLDARNREMTDQILVRLQPGHRPFIAVGAGHFGQRSGLLAGLSAHGLNLKQIETE
jgi:uncharacterized protein YbaP (TraB family)